MTHDDGVTSPTCLPLSDSDGGQPPNPLNGEAAGAKSKTDSYISPAFNAPNSHVTSPNNATNTFSDGYLTVPSGQNTTSTAAHATTADMSDHQVVSGQASRDVTAGEDTNATSDGFQAMV